MKKLILTAALLLGLAGQVRAADIEFGQDYITIKKSTITQFEVFDAAPGFIYDLKLVTTGTVDPVAWSMFVVQKNNSAVAVEDKFIVGTDTVKIARSLINGASKSTSSIAFTSLSFKSDCLQIKDEVKATALLPIVKNGVTINVGAWYAPNYALYWYFRK